MNLQNLIECVALIISLLINCCDAQNNEMNLFNNKKINSNGKINIPADRQQKKAFTNITSNSSNSSSEENFKILKNSNYNSIFKPKRIFASKNVYLGKNKNTNLHDNKIIKIIKLQNESKADNNTSNQYLNNKESLQTNSETKNNLQKTNAKHSLHLSYQFPLKRLSDAQIFTLLKRYQNIFNNAKNQTNFEKITREERIILLQKLIMERSSAQAERLHLIRPTLLTNINVIDKNNFDLDKSSFNIKNSNNTQKEKKTKFIVDSDSNNNLKKAENETQLNVLDDSKTVKELNKFVQMLLKLQKRYNELKTKFLQKFCATFDNEKKKSIAKLFNCKQIKKTQVNSIESTTYVEQSTLAATIDKNFNKTLENITNGPELAIKTTNQNETEEILLSTTNKQNFNTESTDLIDEKENTFKPTYPSELITNRILKFTSPNDKNNLYFQTFATRKIKQLNVNNDQTTILPINISTTIQPFNILSIKKEEGTLTLSNLNIKSINQTDKINLSKNFQKNKIHHLNDNNSPFNSSILTITEHSNNENLTTAKIFGISQYLQSKKESNNERKFFISQVDNLLNFLNNTELINNNFNKAPIAKPIPTKIYNYATELDKLQLANPFIKEIITSEIINNKKLEDIDELNGNNNISKKINLANEQNELIASKSATCKAIACDFEQKNLCQWETSLNKIAPGDKQYKYFNRYARDTNLENKQKQQFIQQTWNNWEGRYKNYLTEITRAQVFSQTNKRFAAAYVKPNQSAILTAKLLTNEQETIRFRAWEATRGLRLRLCCDTTTSCVWETEIGVKRGSRNWKEHTASCPKNTKKIIFECINDGLFQGACGIDNIHLLNNYCPKVISLSQLVEN